MYLKKAMRGTILIFVLLLVGGLFGYLLRFFLARRLTVAEFGLFYSVMTIFLFVSYIVDFGLGQAVSRKIVELTVRNSKKINNLVISVTLIQLVITFCLGLILVFFRKSLSENYFHADASMLLILGAVWIMFIPILALYSNIFYGFQKPEHQNFLDTLKSMLMLGFTVLFMYMGYTILSPALAYVFASVLLVVIFYFVVRKTFPYLSLRTFRFDGKLAFKVLGFGLMIGISNFISLIMIQIDTLLITYFMTSYDVGLYQVAITISYILLFLVNAVAAVLYPLVNDLHFTKKHDRIVEAVNLVYKYLLVILLPAVVIIASFSRSIIAILFSEKYLAASVPLSILVVFTIFCSINVINNLVLTSLGKPSIVFRIVILVAVLNVVLNLITIPLFGLVGAASSTLFSFIVAAIMSSYYLKKYIALTFPVKDWLLLLLISVVLFVETHYLIQAITCSVLLKITLIASLILFSHLLLLFAFRVLKLSETKYLFKTLLGR